MVKRVLKRDEKKSGCVVFRSKRDKVNQLLVFSYISLKFVSVLFFGIFESFLYFTIPAFPQFTPSVRLSVSNISETSKLDFFEFLHNANGIQSSKNERFFKKIIPYLGKSGQKWTQKGLSFFMTKIVIWSSEKQSRVKNIICFIAQTSHLEKFLFISYCRKYFRPI